MKHKITTPQATKLKALNKLYFTKTNIYEQGERAGRMLAHLAKAHTSPPPVPALRDSLGRLHTDPQVVQEMLVTFYMDLYKTKLTATEPEINSFLASLALPTLPREYSNHLDSELTAVEIQEAVNAFPVGKAAGADGLPIEIYKRHSKLLTPMLLKLFKEAVQLGQFPESLYEAAIVLLPKQGKDPHLCESFRPISLLTADVKIFAKVLARRLSRVITKIIHPDQIGFIPAKTAALNTRRLYLNLAHASAGQGAKAIAALDITKAFDTVEWPYLWQVLTHFGFGKKYIQMVQLLYKYPVASIRINSLTTPAFVLSRGTRQGCPLSPLLFAIAIEPFAQAVRAHPQITGFEYPGFNEKVQLYADDTLVYLGDRGPSLTALTDLTQKFGTISGLQTSMAKSVLFLVDKQQPNEPLDTCPLQVSNKFTYLGIQIALPISQYHNVNIESLFQWAQNKFKAWATLPVGPAGRIQLIKMFLLPKVLYALWHSPIYIPKKVFAQLNSLLSKFIWGTSRPRLRLTTLMRPRDRGGLALPDIYIYYVAAQLTHISPMVHSDISPPLYQLWAQVTSAQGIPWPLLLSKKLPRHASSILVLQNKILQAGHKLTKLTQYPPQTPLWHNPDFPQLVPHNPPKVWYTLGLTTIGDVWVDNQVIPLQQLCDTRHLPSTQWLTYHKLARALTSQSARSNISVAKSSIIDTLLLPAHKGKISSLYKQLYKPQHVDPEVRARDAWEGELGALFDVQWEWILSTPKLVSFANRHSLLQLYLIHRAYYTVQRLYAMKVLSSPLCPRCGSETATLVHTLWSCPSLKKYWGEITGWLTAAIPGWAEGTARNCLLTVDLSDTLDNHTKLFILKAMFHARRILTLHWKDQTPPKSQEWKKAMDDTAALERTIMDKRGKLLTYMQIWRHWTDCLGTPVPFPLREPP
uniref:Reverse transcriptase domain-containing protein n=1 Tax=Xenopus tropicalis TaxID=8364 RepID=A0A6I8SLC4_XENTR